MAYPTLLVHLELGHWNNGLLQVACEMANESDAHVVGITGCQPFSMTLGEGYVYGDFFESGSVQLVAQEKEMEATFRQAFSSSVRSLEWRSTTQCVSIADYVAQAGCGADLIMTSGIPAESFDAQRHLNRGDLLMIAGRPLLVVPEKVSSPTVKNVMIAWKDTREARKAVLDALPLLKRAAFVTIVELTTEARLAAARDQLGDIARWLERHDVNVEPNATVSYGDDARQLEVIAVEQGAELTVAGAYGHSRLREWAFGGITRDLLVPSSRCSFLSH